jgi:transcriptional regulator with XRE-family HTH domain
MSGQLHPSHFCNKNVIMRIVQCRMARSGLRWTLDDFAHQSGVSRRTIARFELGEKVTPQTVEALRKTLERAGAKFVDEDQIVGVLLALSDT